MARVSRMRMHRCTCGERYPRPARLRPAFLLCRAHLLLSLRAYTRPSAPKRDGLGRMRFGFNLACDATRVAGDSLRRAPRRRSYRYLRMKFGVAMPVLLRLSLPTSFALLLFHRGVQWQGRVAPRMRIWVCSQRQQRLALGFLSGSMLAGATDGVAPHLVDVERLELEGSPLRVAQYIRGQFVVKAGDWRQRCHHPPNSHRAHPHLAAGAETRPPHASATRR
ncbi:hypothetical protein B0H16DRAFT_1632833 [Mycena metata]|uniref:Uncharacterized protein n=1 Tax=Mycena metata TaxID=1033252 RepID=A0AAD7GZL3_9AGAR|nr:hypothetical protein B0H16DRAFT_1632833 [Mycena metata]